MNVDKCPTCNSDDPHERLQADGPGTECENNWHRKCDCDDCEMSDGDDLADALTPDEMWNEGGIKD